MKKKLLLCLVLFTVMLSIFLIDCRKSSTVGSEGSKVPVVTLKPVTDITGTSAISGGVVTNAANTNLLDFGVCWSISPNPTISDNKISCSNDSVDFGVTIQGLFQNFTYFVRAYVTTSYGTTYSKQSIFTTLEIPPTPPTPPVITTAALTNVTESTATGGGNIDSDGGDAITAKGVCWSSYPNPTIADSKTYDGSGSGSFSSSITGLTTAKYFIRAYATNSVGTAYGNEVGVHCGVPTINTIKITYILIPQAFTCTYSITAPIEGNSDDVLARGVCVGSLPYPTITDCNYSNDGTGLGSFTSKAVPMTLVNGTTYYFRAYIINSCGTFYGNQISCRYSKISDASGCL